MLIRRGQIALGNASAFNHFEVSVNWRVSQLVYFAAGPANLNAVNFLSRAQAKQFPWLVRGQIAAAGRLQPASFQASNLPGDKGANSRGIALGSDQLQTKPVVLVAAFVT